MVNNGVLFRHWGGLHPVSLEKGFIDSVHQYPDRSAVEVDGRSVSYRQLATEAQRIALTLQQVEVPGPAFTGIYGQRSLGAFAGVLGSLLSGRAYVPLGANFPAERSRKILDRADCRAIVVDRGAEPRLSEVITDAPPLVLIFPEHATAGELSSGYESHRVFCADDLADGTDWTSRVNAPDDIAYVLFTSGSTGEPKGVPVTHGNAAAFLEHIVERYQLNQEDRFSQTFALTFDLSVFDMFATWWAGGCLCCPPERALFKPGRYIRESELTVWFSVPTTGALMKKFGELKPGRYPSLRLSLFCGEALPVEVVRAWSGAAQNSVIENIYGPTELTIACTGYRWEGDRSETESENGLVPIGDPFPHMEAIVVDEQLREVGPGEMGELLMTGSQMCPGYLNNPEKTRAAFVTPPGSDKTYYRTGDRVRRPADGRPMTYLGRVDHQVQVRGHRVELGEIEHVLRELTGAGSAVALAWPVSAQGAEGIVAFVDVPGGDAAALRRQVQERLPDYMVPSQVRIIPAFPRNGSGKIDRSALTAQLEVGS